MSKRNHISVLTLLLSAVAGFCDTVTFVAADSIFSAHVTGNFIVFASQVILGNNANAWIKLITFPVFVIAVITGGWLDEKKQGNPYFILLVESSLLLFSSAVALATQYFFNDYHPLYWIVMLVVFAMGLQNAFGRLYAKETYGPTTMMTGNTTQASLSLRNYMRKLDGAESSAGFKKQLYPLGGFLFGCLSGALISKWAGLFSIIIPGIAIVICYHWLMKNRTTPVESG
jgi:uncharacterized membrane protein YoaK (UPF0700 family)